MLTAGCGDCVPPRFPGDIRPLNAGERFPAVASGTAVAGCPVRRTMEGPGVMHG